MNKIISPKITALTFGILILCFIAAFYVIAWQEPSQSPPGGNVSTPINVGTSPQAKAGRISATEFYDYNDPNYYLDPSGDSKLSSLTIIGGTSLPACNSSYRGKEYLLQTGSGAYDKLYLCQKNADNTYSWVSLGRVPKGPDVSTTKPGIGAESFNNSAAYNLHTNWVGYAWSPKDEKGIMAYCLYEEGGGGWHPIPADHKPSLERFCLERGQVYKYHMSTLTSSGWGLESKCQWDGSKWVYIWGNTYGYEGWLWCEEGP